MILTLASAGLGGWSSYNAYQQGKYGLAAFYFVTGFGSAILLQLQSAAQAAPPQPEPEPITDPSRLLGGAPEGFQQPWAGPILETVLDQDIVAYRVSSSGAARGEWFFAIRPATAGEAITSAALPPSNSATYIQQVVIPAGTQIQIGIANGITWPGTSTALPGGAVQIFVEGGLPPSAFGAPAPTPIGLLGN